MNLQETGPFWLKFEQALANYEDVKKYSPTHFYMCNFLLDIGSG